MDNLKPPRRYAKCFKWFCADEYYEELQGDLEEAYYQNKADYGIKKANAIYRKEVLLMLRPSVIRKIKGQFNNSNNNIDMIRNYIKIAIRNIRSQKVYSIINIFGLAVGMAATILITLFVQYELSYDQYNEKADRIYRVSREWLNQDGESSLHLGHLAPPFAPLMKNDFDGLAETVVRLNSGYGPLMTAGDKRFEEENYFWADPDVFDVFTWNFISGNPDDALNEPNTIVLTETAAKRYFGEEDPVGSSITFNNFGAQVELNITGVIEDIPDNSHFHPSMLASFGTLENFFGRENMMRNWGSNNYSTFILLEEGKTIRELEQQIPGFIDKHLGQMNDGSKASTVNKLHFMKLTDVHLHSHLDSEIESNGDIKYVYTYSVIALFVLLIACINFMNLSTARSMKRAKEVGVRKTMGAFRSSLIRQFITESILIATLSAILALLFVSAALPWFNNFAEKQLSLSSLDPLFFGGFMLLVILVVGLLAGSYPAFVLSGFSPVKVLKGQNIRQGGVSLRSSLVVFQFFISICLLIGVGVIGDQIDYMKTKDLGFDKENVVVLPALNWSNLTFGQVKNRLSQHEGIEEVTLTSRVPSGRLLDSQGGQAEIDGEMVNIDFRIADVHVDHEYLDLLGVEFLAGRNFDAEIASDSSEAFVLNKAAIVGLGWQSAEDAVGKKFNYGGRNGYVIGVVEDFHFESLHQTIAPIVFLVSQGRASSVMVKVKEGSEDEVVAYLKDEWSQWREGFPFDYYTIGDRFDQQYEAEEKLGELVNYFSFLAIFVAILGLFGLSAYSIEQQVKEIGIRKVLGASVKNVVFMFIKRFAILVLVGILIAIPASYYGMTQWLSEFPYATALKPSTFAVGALIALVFALATVSYEIIKAALMNPVDTLRSE